METSFAAFISYSHAKDRDLAAALQSAIQKLGKPWYKRRAVRVFRDDTSLSASPHLWGSIEEALQRSEKFILLACPESAASRWVNKEVVWWIEHKSIDSMLIGLTEGELRWDENLGGFSTEQTNSVPQALLGHFAVEPKWVDLRTFREVKQLRSRKFLHASADFASFIRGVPKEDLFSEEVRQQRVALTMAASAAVALFLFALAATVFGLTSYVAERRAASNYAAAKTAADNLIRSIAADLREQKGVTSSTLNAAFNSVNALIESIESSIKQQGALLHPVIRDGLDRFESGVYAIAPPSDQIEDLELSRSALLYEFAETYHRSAFDIDSARDKAKSSLEIRERLRFQYTVAHKDASEIDAQIALTKEEIGDLARKSAEAAASDPQKGPPDYTETKSYYEEALSGIEPLVGRFPDRVDYVREYGQILTRLGDVDIAQHNHASAVRRYEKFFSVAVRIFRRRPNDEDAVHELGWGFRKMGEVEDDPVAEAASFADELCVRRELSKRRSNYQLYERDLGYALTRLGAALLKERPPATEQARDAYFEALHIRMEVVSSNFERQTIQELAEGLEHASEVFKANADSDRSLYYSQMAKDVRQGMEESFPLTLPKDSKQGVIVQNIAAERRRQGVRSLFKLPTIELDSDLQEFEVVDMGRIVHESQECWTQLQEKINLWARSSRNFYE